MTIQEALKKNKLMYRPKHDLGTIILPIDDEGNSGFFTCENEPRVLTLEDIEATDWEVEEEKIELSWSEIEQYFDGIRDGYITSKHLKEELGFKDD